MEHHGNVLIKREGNENRKMCRKANFIILTKLKTAVNGDEKQHGNNCLNAEEFHLSLILKIELTFKKNPNYIQS